MNSAEVLVKFKGDSKDLDDKTNKSQSTLKGFASAVGSAFKVAAIGVTAATTAVGALAKQSVEAYADFEQLKGGLISLFGEGSTEMQKIMKLSENAYKDLTMSQNQYLTSFQSAYPLVNAGLSDNADSIEYTNKMLQISSDLFNTYGGSVEQYQNAINWALKGSFVYLDNLNLGIKGTQEGFVEAANASGILGREIKNVSELTSDEIIDVIQHYSKEYGVWEKTADEASTTIIGSLNMVKSTWTNLVAGFAKGEKDTEKLIDQLITSVITFGENIAPIILNALTSIAQALPTIFEKIGALLPQIVESLLPPLLQSIEAIINAVMKALPGLLNVLIPLLMNTLISIIQSLAQALPQIIQALIQGIVIIIKSLAQALPTIIPTLITAILDGILTLLDHIDEIIDAGIELILALADGLIAAMPVLIEKGPIIIEKIVAALIRNLPKLTLAALEIILKLAAGIIQYLPQLLGYIPSIIDGIVRGLLSGLGSLYNVGKDLLTGLWNGINGMKDWVVNKVKSIGKSILGGIKNVLGIHSPSTEFAIVGKYSVLGYTEALDDMSKEVQKQVNDTFGLSPQLTNSMNTHYSPNVNVYNNVDVSTDPLGQTVSNIKTFSGGARNDYNYGMGV